MLWLPDHVQPSAPHSSAHWPTSQSQHLYASAGGPSGGWVPLCGCHVYHCRQLIVAGSCPVDTLAPSSTPARCALALEAPKGWSLLSSGPPFTTPRAWWRPSTALPSLGCAACRPCLPDEPSALKSWSWGVTGRIQSKTLHKGTVWCPASGRRRMDADQHWSLSFIGSSGRKRERGQAP